MVEICFEWTEDLRGLKRKLRAQQVGLLRLGFVFLGMDGISERGCGYKGAWGAEKWMLDMNNHKRRCGNMELWLWDQKERNPQYEIVTKIG